MRRSSRNRGKDDADAVREMLEKEESLSSSSSSDGGSDEGSYDSLSDDGFIADGTYEDEFKDGKPESSKAKPPKLEGGQKSLTDLLGKAPKKSASKPKANKEIADKLFADFMSSAVTTEPKSSKSTQNTDKKKSISQSFAAKLSAKSKEEALQREKEAELAEKKRAEEKIKEEKKTVSTEQIKRQPKTQPRDKKPEIKPQEPVVIPDVVEEDPLPAIEESTTRETNKKATFKLNNFEMYLFNIIEDSGKLYLFGKAKSNEREMVTVCVVISNARRIIHFLPTMNEIEDCKSEVQSLSSKAIVYPEYLRYAFGESDIDFTSQWVTAEFPGNLDVERIPMIGKHYTKVFGWSSSITECFIMRYKIMGPCWIKFKKLMVQPQASVAIVPQLNFELKDEFSKSEPEIEILPKTDIPAFNIACISLRTEFDQAKKQHVIRMISMRILEQCDITELTSPKPKKFNYYWTHVNTANKDVPDTACRSEYEMLNRFLTEIQNSDIDLIMSYGFNTFDGQVIAQRLIQLKVKDWYRIGRLKRSLPKDNITKFSKNTLLILGGRLPVDVRVFADEFLHSKANDFASVIQQELDKSVPEFSITNFDALVMRVKDLKNVVIANDNNTTFLIMLSRNNNFIPLTLQIAQLSGATWSRVLLGKASPRSEALLAHEFINRGYVIPDKSQVKVSGKREDAQYQGGHVLDPKRGFHENIVTVLDYNSLYPSIIRQYNICFTTRMVSNPNQNNAVLPKIMADLLNKRLVVKNEIKEKEKPMFSIMTQLEEKEHLISELNHEISQAQAKKADVSELTKKLNALKQETLPLNSQMKQYKQELSALNIKQLAVKILANSMYGYLGYKGSRFPATKLAEEITKKGREALQAVIDIVEHFQFEDSDQFSIVYGDTDSVMVDCRTKDDKKAKQIAAGICAQVEEHFKKQRKSNDAVMKLGLDHLFKKMLLVSKKKYAALEELPNGSLKVEKKGLDSVRRDWCFLTRYLSDFVIRSFMFSENADDSIKDILTELDRIAKMLRNNGSMPEDYNMEALSREDEEFKRIEIITPKDLVITKSLTNKLESYRGDNSAHVVVAKYMQDVLKKDISPGTTIKYIISRDGIEKLTSDGEPMSERSQRHANIASKAVYEDLVQKVDDADIEWYITNQIFNPIWRLCEAFGGMEKGMLAKALNISYTAPSVGLDNDYQTNLMIPHAAELTYSCPYCENRVIVTPFPSKYLKCPHCNEECNWRLAANLIMRSLRQFVSDNSTSHLESKGFMESEFESVQLPLSTLNLISSKTPLKFRLNPGQIFNTLRYFAHIFSPRKDVAEEDAQYEEFRSYMGSQCSRFLSTHGFSHINFALWLGGANNTQAKQEETENQEVANEEENANNGDDDDNDEADSVVNTDEENDEI